MERDENLAKLIKAAAGEPALCDADLAGFERRVMLEVARRAVMRSRRRSRFGVAASLSGLAMLLAACVTLVVALFPTNILLELNIDGAVDTLIAGIRAFISGNL